MLDAKTIAMKKAPQDRRVWMAAGLIVVATLVAYLPAVRGGFIWDDDAHVTKPEVRSLIGLYRIWFQVGATQQYYPLLHSAFWIEHKLWGDHVVGYHLLNIALHAGAAVMVLFVVRRLLMERKIAWAEPAAILTAAVFALHPVHVESVAWITEQKNTLSAVFYLAAMATYLRFDGTRDRNKYILATALFVLCLLTKPVTVTLPVALLVIYWWQRGRLSIKRDLVPLAPWFFLSLVSGLFAAWVERDVIGATGDEFTLSAVQRIILPGRIAWFYLSKLIWPNELIYVYPRWSVDPAQSWQWTYTFAFAVVLIALAALSRNLRGPLAAITFFVVSLFPVLGFFNVYLFQYTFVADHFQYLASLGVIVLVCSGIAAAAPRFSSPGLRTVCPLVLPAVLGVLTFRQCRMYGDIEGLYQTTLRKNPKCWMAYNNLGVLYKDKGRYDEAISNYSAALKLRPDYPEAHNNLGVVYNTMGRYETAIVQYQEALRLRPDYVDALGNLVVPLTQTGRLDEAIQRSEKAIGFDPDNARVRINLGIALIRAGRLQEAIDQFEEAIRIRPDLLEAHWNRAAVYDAMRKIPGRLPQPGGRGLGGSLGSGLIAEN
jgi:tetratricopeptide (TPR) repeat protein